MNVRVGVIVYVPGGYIRFGEALGWNFLEDGKLVIAGQLIKQDDKDVNEVLAVFKNFDYVKWIDTSYPADPSCK